MSSGQPVRQGGRHRKDLQFSYCPYRLRVIFPNTVFQVRTRGSIKRRPPSRRFRRSQSDCGELGDCRVPEPSQENGAQEDAGDEVFLSKSKTPGPPPPGEAALGREGRETLGSHEKPPLRRTSSRTEKQEEKARAPEEAPQPEKAARDAQEAAAERRPEPSTEAENGGGNPSEERPALEQGESTAEVKEEGAGGKEEPPQQSQDTKQLEEGAVAQETPQSPPGGVEGGLTPEEGKGQEKQEEGTVLEPGCNPTTGSEVPETEVGGSARPPGESRSRASQAHLLCCSLQSITGQLRAR